MADRKRTICILGATFDTGNMGVSVLTAGAIKCALHQSPGGNVFLLDYRKTGCTYTLQLGGRQVSVPLVNMRFSTKVYLRNNIAFLILLALIARFIPSWRIRQKIVRGNECLRQVQQADIVASMAGGDSFSDIYGLERLFYVSLPQLLVLLMGKPLVLLPQTLGPFKSRISRVVAKYIFRHAELIYSRDYRGLRETRELLGPAFDCGKLQFCYDVGFVLDPTPKADLGVIGLPDQRSQDSCLVGLNISGLLSTRGLNHKNMFGFKLDYDALVYSLIDFIIEEKKASVLLIPHVFGTDAESDTPVCKKAYEELKTKYGNRLGFAEGTYDQSEIKHVIGQCDFFIGSRMHACIAAISQNVPAVSIAYSDKFIGVMATVGVQELVADPRKMDQEEILGIVDKAYEQRSALRQQLAIKMPEVKQTALNLFADLYDRAQGLEGSNPREAERVEV